MYKRVHLQSRDLFIHPKKRPHHSTKLAGVVYRNKDLSLFLTSTISLLVPVSHAACSFVQDSF